MQVSSHSTKGLGVLINVNAVIGFIFSKCLLLSPRLIICAILLLMIVPNGCSRICSPVIVRIYKFLVPIFFLKKYIVMTSLYVIFLI